MSKLMEMAEMFNKEEERQREVEKAEYYKKCFKWTEKRIKKDLPQKLLIEHVGEYWNKGHYTVVKVDGTYFAGMVGYSNYDGELLILSRCHKCSEYETVGRVYSDENVLEKLWFAANDQYGKKKCYHCGTLYNKLGEQ